MIFSAIKIVPTGVSKAVKKLIQSKVPDLSKFQDVDEFLQKSGNLSESEVELDSAANTVVLPQPISSRGNIASEKSAIRYVENLIFISNFVLFFPLLTVIY